MNTQPSLDLGLLPRLTQKANLKQTRYGWLRLTPAYSVHLVSDILENYCDKNPVVLDPFCGTGTTALVCAEKGVQSDTTDINPFLLWLTQTKTQSYSREDRDEFEQRALEIEEIIRATNYSVSWVPPLYQIEKWWSENILAALSRAMSVINRPIQGSNPATDLLKIAFCRLMIEWSNASFSHQSMSFKKSGTAATISLSTVENEMSQSWLKTVISISQSAGLPVIGNPQAILCDARHLTKELPEKHYSCVITSPPYPNRMSYIRELRPYMYWLGYLENGRDAGELDWKAIGGTWGCATSNVAKWMPERKAEIPHKDFYEILSRIADTSPLLSSYVHKYFYDMRSHIDSIFRVLKPGGDVHYVVGNSKFYDVMLPVEEIFASLFRHAGFNKVEVRTIRKRTSKKELFEYVVSASKPG